MKEFFKDNIKFLEEKNPELLEKIENVKPDYSLALSLSCSGEISFDRDLSHSNVLVVLGFGLGDHIKCLLRIIPSKTLVIIVEPDLRIFKAALNLRDLSEILSNQKIILFLNEEPYKLKNCIEDYFGLVSIINIETIENENFIQNNPSYFEEIKKIIKEINAYAYINIATLKLFTKKWPKNFLKNIIPFIKYPGIIKLYNSFPKLPAIIISSGPSLNKNVKLLRKAKDYFILISVDTALPILIREKIIPHFVFTIEANPKNLECFKNIPSSEIVLCANISVYPPILKKFKGSIFIDNGGLPFALFLERFIDRKGFLSKGGSVSTNCFTLAQIMGCNPIIMVGLDLSYPEDIFYAEGVPEKIVEEREKILNKNRDYIFLEDNFGNLVKSDHNMKNWKIWYEDRIKETPKITYINATEGGVKIEGTKFLKLKEVIKEYGKKKINVDEIIKEILNKHQIPNIENLIKEFKDIIEEYQTAFYLATQGREICRNLLNYLGNEEENSKRISQSLTRAYHLYKEISNLKRFFFFSQWNFQKLLFEIERDFRKRNQKNISCSYKHFFKEVVNISSILIKPLLRAEEQLKIFKVN